MFLVLGLILLLPCALAFQMVRINLIKGDELRSLWSEQAIEIIPIPAERGQIYDANGTLLATNVADYKIALDPKVQDLTEADIDTLFMVMAEVTGRPQSYFKSKLKNAPLRSRYIVLDKNLSVTQKEAIDSLQIHGVIIEENFKRKYTFGSLAAHVLGFVNHDLAGRSGIEAFYNEELKGKEGQQQVRSDPMNRIYAYVGAPRKLPVQGYSIHTTIDAYIQAILEDELKQGVIKTKSNYGTAIVMDPESGAIKAMANYPTYDPNTPGMSDDENRRNYAIADRIEPGSTFKLVTAIAAVEQDLVDFEEQFDTGEGEMDIYGLKIRDHDPLGVIDFEEVIQKSSNVATAQIAMRMEADVFYQYARNMGFGTLTNVDLAGEVPGALSKPYNWSAVSLPFIAHGYEVLTTPLQITSAYAAFANGGKLMRPYVVEKVVDDKGNIIKENEPLEIRKIARKKTLQTLLPVFESVLEDSGTAGWADVEGLAIAGKTGTAKKVVDGRYQNFYRASFTGFFPSRDPKYVIYILLDEPKTSVYGGYAAGPIFRQTATRIAGLDDHIQREMNLGESELLADARVPLLRGLSKKEAALLLKKLGFAHDFDGNGSMVLDQWPEPGDSLAEDSKISLVLNEIEVLNDSTKVPDGYAVIPQLRGLNMRKAVHEINKAGFEAQLIGSGTVYTQYPRAGDLMRTGFTITVRGKARSMETLNTVVAANDD
jgi:cell division protein FtsI (penicillin-binding protein 3)